MARKAAAAKTDESGVGDPFELSGVDPIEPPVDGDTGKWCKYTIIQGKNVITGYKKGSRTAVTKAAKVIVADLNERRFGRRGRIQ